MTTPTLIRKEVVTLASRFPNGVLMYPGPQSFTWIKPPHMPWILLSIEPAESA